MLIYAGVDDCFTHLRALLVLHNTAACVPWSEVWRTSDSSAQVVIKIDTRLPQDFSKYLKNTAHSPKRMPLCLITLLGHV